MPSTPTDAKGLLKSAIRDPNPVIFIEDMLLYFVPGPVPEEEYLIPIGSADVKRRGTDVTVVTWSKMVGVALKAADQLSRQGIDMELVDLRTTLCPWIKRLSWILFARPVAWSYCMRHANRRLCR